MDGATAEVVGAGSRIGFSGFKMLIAGSSPFPPYGVSSRLLIKAASPCFTTNILNPKKNNAVRGAIPNGVLFSSKEAHTRLAWGNSRSHRIAPPMRTRGVLHIQSPDATPYFTFLGLPLGIIIINDVVNFTDFFLRFLCRIGLLRAFPSLVASDCTSAFAGEVAGNVGIGNGLLAMGTVHG